MPATPKNYWMLVTTPENFEVTRRMDFQVQGMWGQHRRKMRRIEPGDRLLYYVLGWRVFPASVTVTSPVYEDTTPLWYPHGSLPLRFRIKLRPDLVLEPEDYIRAGWVAFRFEYVKRWAPEDWYLAFLTEELHLIPKVDFLLIEEEMRRLLKRKRGRGVPSPAR